jgi:hypothetical protein
LESELIRGSKFVRARRNALKAAALMGAFLSTSCLPDQAPSQGRDDGNKGSSNNGNNGNSSRNGNSGSNSQNGNSGQNGNTGRLCFARGTLVRIREGSRPVEALTAGDEVAVCSGGFAPIKVMVSHTLNSESGKWVGKSNLPVLIRRGALGENSPSADLCLTAWHSVYIDGFLIPVGDLVNGTSIIFEAVNGRDTLDFFQIELDSHDILDAQGVFCESLYRAGTERCAPLLRLWGGRSQLRSRLRSVASIVVDLRQPIDIIRDKLEERGLEFAWAA